MTTEYDYSLSADFAGGLNNNQLMTEINASPSISPVCTNVSTDGDLVQIWFDSSLSAPEIVELDAIIAAYVYVPDPTTIEADSFIYGNVAERYEAWTVTKTITTSPTAIDGMSLVTGELGEFTGSDLVPASDGIYLYNVSATCNAGLNPYIKLRVKNSSTIIFGSDPNINGATAWCFMGAGGFYTTSNSINFTAEMPVASADVTFVIRFVKLFTAS